MQRLNICLTAESLTDFRSRWSPWLQTYHKERTWTGWWCITASHFLLAIVSFFFPFSFLLFLFAKVHPLCYRSYRLRHSHLSVSALHSAVLSVLAPGVQVSDYCHRSGTTTLPRRNFHVWDHRHMHTAEDHDEVRMFFIQVNGPSGYHFVDFLTVIFN